MIQRYRPYQDHAGWTHGMDEAKEGPFVRFSDYDALAAELAVRPSNEAFAEQYALTQAHATAAATADTRAKALEAALRDMIKEFASSSGEQMTTAQRDALRSAKSLTALEAPEKPRHTSLDMQRATSKIKGDEA